MITAIIGEKPTDLGQIALLGVELCVQKIEQTPDTVAEGSPSPLSVRELLEQTWGPNSKFETYIIRPNPVSTVLGNLFKLTEKQWALVAEWEMVEYGWYKRMFVDIRQSKSLAAQAETEGLREGQDVDRVVDGIGYKTYLNDKGLMIQKAEQTRLAYMAREGR
jgi:hypothetical protein